MWACSLTLVAGCEFGNEVPEDAIILCRSDAECPPGFRCDSLRHECLDPSAPDESPSVLDVHFEPALVSSGTVQLVIEADRALSDTPAQVVFASGARGLPLSFIATEDRFQRFLVQIGDAVPEGVYAVASVTVQDVNGNLGIREVESARLVVDRTAPLLYNPRIAPPPSGDRYADLAPFDAIEARFLANEPIAEASLLLGGEAAPCTAVAALAEHICLLIVHPEMTGGELTPRLVAQDIVGNQVTVVLPPLIVDVAPPAISPGSVTVAISASGMPVPRAAPGTVVEIALGVDEVLATPPELWMLTTEGQVPLAMTAQVELRYSFRAPGDLAPVGTWLVQARLTDVFAHHAVVEVPLPAPFAAGIPVAATGVAPVCPLGPHPGSCVDVDMDGHPAQGSCLEGDDLDDFNPLVYPAAQDIPGDGLDNDGEGGDLPIDERVGVFVDSEAGDDANPGTRAAPVRGLDAAEVLRDALGHKYFFLAARGTPYTYADPAEVLRRSVVGGLDPDAWTRTGARSVITHKVAMLGGGTLVTDSVVIESYSAGGTLVRSSSPSIDSNGRVVDCDGMNAGVSGALVFASRIQRLTAHGTNRLNRVQVSGAVSTNGRLIAVNCYLGQLVIATGSATAEIYHSTVRSTGVAVSRLIGAESVKLVGCLLESSTIGPVLDMPAGSLTLIDSHLHNAGGPLARVDGVDMDLPELNACVPPACVASSGNSAGDPGFATLYHLGSNSMARDRDVDVFAHGAPDAALVDIDGECRFTDGSADVGADEAP